MNDASTGELTQRLYAVRYGAAGVVNKAQSLRQAQLALINGAPPGVLTAAERSVSVGGAAKPLSPPQAVDPARPHAHPFYWAPFVLMGNWL